MRGSEGWNSAAWRALVMGSCVWGLLLVAAPVPAQESAAPDPVEPRALELFRAMAGNLGSVQAARVESDYSLDVVLEGGEKVEYGGASEAWLRRPDRLRTRRQGERADTDFFYDGERISLHLAEQGFYATHEAPGELDALLDFALDRLDLAPPGLDLLYSDGGLALLEGVTSAAVLGSRRIAGRDCHHLAFRAPGVDWQIWIEKGERPFPCRYVITTTGVEGAPTSAVTFHTWETGVELPDSLFTFTPPEGARPIAFRESDADDARGGEETR